MKVYCAIWGCHNIATLWCDKCHLDICSPHYGKHEGRQALGISSVQKPAYTQSGHRE